MKTITEIIRTYTAKLAEHPEQADALLKEVNAELAAAGAAPLIPGKNALTTEEVWKTTVGHFPAQANGYGLMCSGTGTVDKVHVVNGTLGHAIKEHSTMISMVGRTYYLEGDGRTLTEERPAETASNSGAWVENHLERRKDRAGQTDVRVETRERVYLVSYDEKGYAVRSRPYIPQDQQ